jgi:hypothetical protein
VVSGFKNAETAAVVSGLAACSTTATLTSTVAGSTYPITCTQNTLVAANYDFPVGNFNAGALTVNRAHLTVTADPKGKILNAPNPTLTATLSGFKNNETATAVVTGSASCSTSAVTTSPVGSYTITCSIGSLAAANYDFTPFVAGLLTIGFRYDGFLQPINDTAHTQSCGAPCPMSIFKSGSTIPVKFQLKDANGVVVQAAGTVMWTVPIAAGTVSQPVDESTATLIPDTGNAFVWDGSQYHYNWSTKGLAANSLWYIGWELSDGQKGAVYIGLK